MRTKRSTVSQCQRVPCTDIVFLLLCKCEFIFETSLDYDTNGKSCQVCRGPFGLVSLPKAL